MKCIILAAGYATRLYPLTENFPKPLLEVGGLPILDHLINDLEKKKYINEYIVVSNHKFIDTFKKWRLLHQENITIIDDGTTCNDERLGALNDIKLALMKFDIKEDVLVIAGDNLLDFSLNDFIDYAKKKKSSCVMTHKLDDINALRKTGVLEIDNNDLVINMEEKPQNPKSNYACPPFYYYLNSDLRKIDDAILKGCNTDAPGSFVRYLCHYTKIYAYIMPGKRYDIGDIESYEKVKKLFKKKEI